MKREPTRADQRAATALRVLGAARDEFEASGFEDASIRRIAERAGVSAGTVMHHYGDKGQLLCAALYEALDAGLTEGIRSVRRGPVLSQLMHLARAVFAVYEARPVLARTLLKEALFAGGPWGQRFVAQTARAHAAARKIAEGAVARGEVAADTDLDAVGLAFLSFFDFALLAWVQGAPLPNGPMGLVERLLRAHLRAPADSAPKKTTEKKARKR